MIPEWVQSDYMPGFVLSVIAVFIFAFLVSKFGHIALQLLLFALSISTLLDDEIGMIGKVWVFSGWAGFLTYRLGLHYLLLSFSGGFKERMKAKARGEPRFDYRTQEPQAYQDADEDSYHRRENFRQAQDSFAERERQRQSDRARQEQKEREEFARREREAYEEARRYARDAEEAERQRAEEEADRQREEQARREREQRQQQEREQHEQRRSEPKPESGNWWEVLGVPRESDLAAIKKAHRKLVMKYHPDKVDGLGVEFKEIAEAKMKAINAAYQEAKNLKG